MFRLTSSIAFALFAAAAAETCDPQKGSCDETMSDMRVSMLQKHVPVGVHDHAKSEVSDLEDKKKALLAELEHVDSELALLESEDQSGEEKQETYPVVQGEMYTDPNAKNKKCGAPGSTDRVFEFNARTLPQASQQACLDVCKHNPECVAVSGGAFGFSGAWCFGCKTSLNEPADGVTMAFYKNGAMLVSPNWANFKCGADSSSPDRTFTQNGLSEQQCKDKCAQDSTCIAVSGGAFGKSGAWCNGCKKVPAVKADGAISYYKIGNVYPDFENENMKCGVPGSPDRVFSLKPSTQRECIEACNAESTCVAVSGGAYGKSGAWCYGCSVALSEPSPDTKAFKKYLVDTTF